MIAKLFKSYGETKNLSRPIRIDEELLRDLETKYRLDRDKLAAIGIS